MSRNEDASLALGVRGFVEGAEVRGKIREDGGDIRFEGLEGRVVKVCMTAACADCPAAPRTVRHFVEPAVRSRFGQEFQVKARFLKPYFKA